ncbi:MAG: hypothetical protein WCO93_03095 [bacterium]
MTINKAGCPLRGSLLFILLVLPALLFSQIKIKTYTSATDTFYWKKYEQVRKPKKMSLKPFVVANPSGIIESFIAGNLADFPQFTNDSVKRYTVRDLRKSLYPVDINGDGRSDMIFCGFSGGEADLTRIFLNQGSSFKLVFEDYQYIVSLSFKGGKLARIRTADPGCCDAYLYFQREYEVRYTDGFPDFVKGRQTVDFSHAERPLDLIDKPFKITSRYDVILIRASAAIQDEPYNPYMETRGNIIGGYKQKIRATVLAVKQNRVGDEWFYVEIVPDIKPAKSIFYDIEKYPTFIRAWVDAEEVMIDPVK